jgi:hypothetical protein
MRELSCRQRIALAALTLNRFAACRHDSPPFDSRNDTVPQITR